MYCHSCGNKISDAAVFCPYCGTGTASSSDTSIIPSSDTRKKQLPITLAICFVLIAGLLCFFAGKLLWSDNSNEATGEKIVVDEAEDIASEEVDESNNTVDATPAETAQLPGQRIFDYAEVFTSEEIVNLETSIYDIIEKSGFDIAVLSQNEGIEDTQKYAEKFYTDNKLGIGSDSRGILFFLDLQNNTYYICTAGSMKDVITDERMESLHLTHDIFLKQSGWRDVISLSCIMLESFLHDDGYIDFASSPNVSNTPLPSPDAEPTAAPDEVIIPPELNMPGQYYSVIGNYSKALKYDSSEVFDYFDETDINVFFVAYDMTESNRLGYAYYDVNNDEVCELLIVCLNDDETTLQGTTSRLIDMYSMNGEKMIRTFGLDSFGYRERLHLLEDGRLLTEGSSSAFCCSCEVYELNSNGKTTEVEAYFYDTRGDEEEYFDDNYVKLSESAYYSKLESFPLVDLDCIVWWPI